MEEWGFIWLMFVLKIPILALLYLVWWATRPVEDPSTSGADDGGSQTRHHPPDRPRRRPRGPHGDPAPLPAPPRVRTEVKQRRQPEFDR